MRKRKYLIGASLGVIGALVVSGTALAGVPTGQTLQATASPSKNINNTPGTIHNIISTTYSDFNASTPAKETKFTLAKGLSLGNGNAPACSPTTLQSSTTTTAVQSQCQASIVGQGTAVVNNGTSPLFPGTNPVLLVKGGPTTLFVWVRIGGAQTLVLNGAYAKGPNTLDVTGLPNVAGVDLTNFDTTFNRAGKQSYVKVSCPKGKWVSSETTTFYDGSSLTATSKQKCKAKKKK
jgi:hypothetical protein